ncbi:MAG TPA: 5-(carboxyamino)imidazole ribonucleotide synthase [Rhodanobacteraceae bacterium]|nr:5-(carboxyamino)imidazole ribonucleotide synthase [Rhodanobacteraceae bacterium]
MTTLGVLGGGQLARMMVLAGTPLGVRFRIVDPVADACAGQIAPLLVTGWDAFGELESFARGIDAATFDFENVPAETAEWLASRTRVAPNALSLRTAQDRVLEKTLFRECGLPTTEFTDVATRADLDATLARIGAPAILKTRREGYDGKGQFRIRTRDDADAAWQALGAQAAARGLILEGFVPFDYEASVVAVRASDGEFRAWPVTRNWHVDGILSASLAPAVRDGEIDIQAFAHARAIAERLDYVGVFALELFVKDGELLGNEMAPRVHNSGHWTIEGAVTSQFENHVRAVLGFPLGDTSACFPSCMLNWVGELPDRDKLLAIPGVHWHDYGKSPRPGRKVGHATVCAPEAATLAERLQQVGRALGRESQVAPVIEALRDESLSLRERVPR